MGCTHSRLMCELATLCGRVSVRCAHAADRAVVYTFKNGATRSLSGRSLLLNFSVPQFFFHVTTAYDILRHAGVDLAKKDFLGPPRGS